ncbi:hypothetical protein Mp_2g12600 [Marchantia polymorpha subsp. ruderalis]|uniref:Uncharacterized protein n=1 Tax=Marchantia polymorpha TaxID=3197 RepID=A0A2R6XAX9_MARPO|nr:hypothetical protein MARPO_0026s0111 [Marchantia polymorpha]BBN02081.1 hypothetical protein Mp_2g12600 [Marchantia polymorpha subsp. ruderalis]|eukprot:PTQ43238.1 hypothetical protein MARPO_0026s0111 [Marchantia polymorpha]
MQTRVILRTMNPTSWIHYEESDRKAKEGDLSLALYEREPTNRLTSRQIQHELTIRRSRSETTTFWRPEWHYRLPASVDDKLMPEAGARGEAAGFDPSSKRTPVIEKGPPALSTWPVPIGRGSGPLAAVVDRSPHAIPIVGKFELQCGRSRCVRSWGPPGRTVGSERRVGGLGGPWPPGQLPPGRGPSRHCGYGGSGKACVGARLNDRRECIAEDEGSGRGNVRKGTGTEDLVKEASKFSGPGIDSELSCILSMSRLFILRRPCFCMDAPENRWSLRVMAGRGNFHLCRSRSSSSSSSSRRRRCRVVYRSGGWASALMSSVRRAEEAAEQSAVAASSAALSA